MCETAGSATIVLYKIKDNFWEEPMLNILAALMQGSKYTHVEIALGTSGTSTGMCNVCRIFNDDVGVEVTARTGLNPQYSYLSIGCSKAAETRMLNYAKSLIGRPFSNVGMARSVVYPRSTDESSFFCAELVACILRQGGLW